MPRPTFPKNLPEFQRQFGTDEACQQYLAACRWPDGFVCPRCAGRRAYAISARRRWQCVACRHQVSLTSGTVLHNTKLPLMQWFWAAYLMTTDTRGVSALLLQRQLGLRRYETAWLMLHKLRRAMVNAAREPLHGAVEVDDTWIGGQQPGLRGSRQLKGRRAALVLVAVEKRGHGSGRVRLAVIPDVKAATLTAFLTQNVAPGSTVYTDGLKSFTGLGAVGLRHIPRTQTPAHRAPSRSHVGGTARRPRHWQPAAMVDRHLSWRQPGTAPGLSGRVRLSTQIAVGHRWRPFQTLLGLGTTRAPTPLRRIRGGQDLSKPRDEDA